MNDDRHFHLGLIGFPLGHSFSPALHAAAFESCVLQGDYKLWPIAPIPEGEEPLQELIDKVQHEEIHGLNITIPHKQNVIPFLDQLTPSARKIGAVNTIYQQDGKLIGENTDAQGFLKDLKSNMMHDPDNKQALVLGAGGSSRAVTYALSRTGWKVVVAARRIEQAEELAFSLSDKDYDITTIHFSPNNLESIQASLIVNTTPLGMSPNITHSPWPTNLPFPENCSIYDLVYNPAKTCFVEQAQTFGLDTASGLGMLVEQAALSFEIWTGHSPSRTAMKNAAIAQFKNNFLKEENHDTSIPIIR